GAAVLTLRFAGAGTDRTRRDEASVPELLTDGERAVAVVVNLEEPLEHVDRPGLRAAPVVGGGRIERPDLLSAVVVTCERDGGYERERKEQRAGENHDPPHRGPPPRLRSVVEAGNPTLGVENDGLGASPPWHPSCPISSRPPMAGRRRNRWPTSLRASSIRPKARSRKRPASSAATARPRSAARSIRPRARSRKPWVSSRKS